MKQNKGFIGIGLILAIVLGVVVVGGGLYSYNTYQNKWRESPPLPFDDNQNLPVTDNEKNNSIIAGCTSTSPSSIKLLSPNGGEMYSTGEKITVKWESCNVTPNSIAFTLFKHDISKPYQQSEMYRTSLFSGSDPYVLEEDDGISEFTLPDYSNTNLTPGQQYFIGIMGDGDATNIGSGYVPGDYSDGLFTINSPVSSVTSCTSDKGKVMTYSKALEIAKTSNCNNVGVFTGEYGCNKNGGGLVDVYMKPSDKPNCGFACRVSIDTGKAEEGWMCTGLLKPIDDNLLKLTSCGVSLSKTSNWSVISNTSNEIVLDILSTDHIVGTSGINIKCVLSNTITDTDAKFGNITYFYDTGKKAWMEIDDKEGEGITPNNTPVLAVPLFTVNGLPVFRGTGRWLTYIVPISPSSILYLKEGDTEGGQTQSLTNLVKTLKKL